MIFLSIIVPVYNTPIEKLDVCFRSIIDFIELNKELNIECIIIDDGSRNSITRWCKNFSEKYPWFKFYKKENEGVSVARNKGIYLSKGEYITFVDSDDILISVENLSQILLSQKYDFVFTDLVTDKQQSWAAFDGNSRDIEITEVVERIVSDGKLNGPYCKFIRTGLLKKFNIKFDKSLISGEDLVFFIDILLQKPKMFYLSKCSYIYNLDDFTSNNRLRNNTAVYIENNRIMYLKMIDLIEHYFLSEERLYYKVKATDRFLKQLFNTAADLYEMGLLSEDKKNILASLLKNLDSEILYTISRKKLSKSAVRLSILLYKNWFLLAVISKLRRLYISLKSKK